MIRVTNYSFEKNGGHELGLILCTLHIHPVLPSTLPLPQQCQVDCSGLMKLYDIKRDCLLSIIVLTVHVS